MKELIAVECLLSILTSCSLLKQDLTDTQFTIFSIFFHISPQIQAATLPVFLCISLPTLNLDEKNLVGSNHIALVPVVTL
jgi:hypothetical protein